MSSVYENPNMERRDFLCRMSMLSAATFTSSFIPVSVFAGTPVADLASGPVEYTVMDEALGNYPGYSETIGFGRLHLVEPAAEYDIDPQVGY